MVSKNFVLLANSTSFDVVSNPFFHVWPVVAFLGFAKSFISAWVPCRWMVIHQVHDSSFDDVDGWYRDSCFWDGSSDLEFLHR